MGTKAYNYVAAIIPARGGSKGLPGKNLLNLCGLPMIAWSILHAHRSGVVDQVFVSSDDEAILRTAEAWGALGIHRPEHLASDTASSESALQHAIDWIESHYALLDLVVFLQATSPLREPDDIVGAIAKLEADQADSLLSCSRLQDCFIWRASREGYVSTNYDYRRRPRRQDLGEQFLENGSIYLFRPEVLRRNNNRLGGKISVFEMAAWKSVQLDDIEAKSLVEWHMRERQLSNLAELSDSASNQ
jgi:CMP-N,N'-diacetyllegionaminic acid synthase